MSEDLRSPLLIDNGLLRKITKTKDSAFIKSVEETLSSTILGFPEILYCATPIQVLEFLGITLRKFRFSELRIEQDMPLDARINLIIEKLEGHFESVIDTSVLMSSAERQKTYLNDLPFSRELFERLIADRVSSPKFCSELVESLTYHSLAELHTSSLGSFSESALALVPKFNGESPAMRVQWTANQTICATLLRRRVEGKVAPVTRALATVLPDMVHDNVMVLVDGEKKELKSLVKFRRFEDRLDAEIIDAVLLGFPSLSRPVTCVTTDSAEQLKCRAVILKRMLNDFLSMIDRDSRLRACQLKPNYGRIVRFNTNGCHEEINLETGAGCSVEIELPDRLTSIAAATV